MSSRWHQIIMLARGLAQEPRILLLDEPTSNLDIRHQIEVAKLLKRLTVEKGILTIMICHDINIASKYSDEIVLLSGGSVYAVGTPGDVITAENLREVYGVVAEVVDAAPT